MILQALNSYYDRVAAQQPEAIAEMGFSDEKISFAVILDRDGLIVDVNDLRESDGRKARPRIMPVPASFKRPGVTPRSFFLWDKTAFVFGVTKSDDDKPFELAIKQHEAFKTLHLDRLREVDDEGLRALRNFVEIWSADRYAQLRYAEDMLDTNIVFRLDGEYNCIHERSRARELWQQLKAETIGDHAICLVTGRLGPIARIHPPIRGMSGQTTGGSIVSFNQPAFTSFGFDQGENAPVSETAAFAYTTALNKLLQKGGRNRTEIADTTVIFWAEATDLSEAEAAECAVRWLFAPSIEQRDASETKIIQDVMERVATGRPLDNADLRLSRGTRFYILGLVAPDPARLSIRFWEATTLGAIGKAFHQHWQDLHIDGLAWRQPPALWQLASRMAPARRNAQGAIRYDTNQVPSNLVGEIMRAILAGRSYPRTILSNVLMRFRSDREVDGLRVALVKASIVREMRRGNPDLPEETYVSLNRDDPDPAYRLGRAFAILEKTQQAALDGINATIRDRFYGSASATPAAVFPILIRNGMHHLAVLRKGRGARWVKKPAATGHWLSSEMGDILNGLDESLPKSFNLEAQGRFAMGYFHQKYARREDAPDDLNVNATDIDADSSAEKDNV